MNPSRPTSRPWLAQGSIADGSGASPGCGAVDGCCKPWLLHGAPACEPCWYSEPIKRAADGAATPLSPLECCDVAKDGLLNSEASATAMCPAATGPGCNPAAVVGKAPVWSDPSASDSDDHSSASAEPASLRSWAPSLRGPPSSRISMSESSDNAMSRPSPVGNQKHIWSFSCGRLQKMGVQGDFVACNVLLQRSSTSMCIWQPSDKNPAHVTTAQAWQIQAALNHL